jgi:isopenicillin N synthase-like dioxygenase
LKDYQNTPETPKPLGWDDLITLDNADFEYPGGRKRFARPHEDAIHTIGFFYITNFGLSPREVEEPLEPGARIFDIANEEYLLL